MAPVVANAPGDGSHEVAVCVDAGTTVIKAVVFDVAGRELVVTRRDTAVRRPARERAEQDMDEVWQAVVDAVVEAVRAADRPVRLLALTAQGDGAWLVDPSGRPVRPAVLWNDGRAAGVVEGWRADGVLEEAFRRNASLTNAGLPNAVLRTLEVEEPAVLDRASSVLTCGGWLFLRLTGVLGIDTSEASAPWLDIARGDYSDDLLALYGLHHRRHLLPPLVPDEDRVHPLMTAAAEQLGIPAGTPVVLAPYDIVATAVGCGATDPGQAACILGTTLCTETVVAAPDISGEPSGLTLALGRPHRLVRPSRPWPAPASSTGSRRCSSCPGRERSPSWRPRRRPARPVCGCCRTCPRPVSGPRSSTRRRAASSPASRSATGARELARAVLEGLAHVIRDCLEAAPDSGENQASRGAKVSPEAGRRATCGAR